MLSLTIWLSKWVYFYILQLGYETLNILNPFFHNLWWLLNILQVQAFGLCCPDLLQLTVLACYSAGLKTLMVADNLSALPSANAAIRLMLLSCYPAVVRTRTNKHTHICEHAKRFNTWNVLGVCFFNDKNCFSADWKTSAAVMNVQR